MSLRPKHSISEKRKKIMDNLWIIILLFGALCVLCVLCYEDKNYMKNFYQKENSLLVEINCENSLYHYAGYIDEEDFQNWKNGEKMKSTITIYNPYTKGKSITIKTKTIKTIKTISFRECYEGFNPQQNR